MKIVKYSINYSVDLPEDMFGLVLDDWTLGSRLEKLPISKIDYDGHFGPVIEFTVIVEDDTPKLHRQVLAICLERWNEIR